MTVERVFLDTNVLVYLFDDAEAKKKARATRLLTEDLPVSQLVVSTQVLQELYVALTRGTTPIATPEVAERAVRDAATLLVVPIDIALTLQAIAEVGQRYTSFWDALIVRAALAAGCNRLLTEDLNAGETVDGLVIENPFA
jgi:predicted nucleic acid-binding protein